MIKVPLKEWSLIYHVGNVRPMRKYVIHLTATGEPGDIFPVFPISVEEEGKPGHEVFVATYPDLSTSIYTDLYNLASEHSSAIMWFESVEDYN